MTYYANLLTNYCRDNYVQIVALLILHPAFPI